MKKTLQNTLKVGAVIALMLSAGAVSAQTITGDITKAENATAGKVDGAVRVIDNKGTIKYLQSSNGITTLTNTTNNVTTTTWQLGGKLTDNTYIDATGKIFAITGVKAVDDASFLKPEEKIAATAYGVTGFTLMVRDEATGETKKLLATDLIVAGNKQFKILNSGDVDVTDVTGLVASISPNKVSVYRNGAKLRVATDYSILDAAIKLEPDTTTDSSSSWNTYKDDIIEVQWIN